MLEITSFFYKKNIMLEIPRPYFLVYAIFVLFGTLFLLVLWK
jgi:hypothetical protein